MLRTSTEPSPAGAALFTTRARQLLAAGRPAEVVEICTRGLARFPNNVGGYLLLIEAYRTLGEPERAHNVLADGVRRTRSARLRRMLERGTRDQERGARSEERGEEHESDGVVQEEVGGESPVAVGEEEREEMLTPAGVEEEAVDTVAPQVSEELAQLENAEEAEGEMDAEPSPEAALAEDADEESEEDRDEVDEVVEDEPSVSVESEEVEESEVIASLGEVASAEDDGPSLQSEAIAAASDSPPTADDVVLAEEDESVEEESDAVAADPLPLVPEPESSIADLSPVASHTESVDAAESENAAVAPPSPTPAEPVEAPSAPTPDAPVRSTASPTAAPRTSSLSLHVRTAPGSNLRSSNLRLIPGLEFAPLRHEEPQRQRQIAALIDESMPEPTLPELAPNAEADPPVSDAESVPPMPAFSESGEGIVVDDVAVEVASSSAPAQIETVVDVEVEEESAVPVELPSVAPTTEEPQVALEVEDGADDVERDDPDSGHLDLDVSDSGTIYNKLDALLPELEESDLALDEPPLPEIQPLPTSRRFRITDNQYPATGNRQPAMTPLEELARKLESARIPIVEESNEPPRPVFEPSIVSDTIAEILVKQGAWAEAMKAFQMLARMKPARHAHYQERIREMRERIAAEAGPPLPDHFSTDG